MVKRVGHIRAYHSDVTPVTSLSRTVRGVESQHAVWSNTFTILLLSATFKWSWMLYKIPDFGYLHLVVCLDVIWSRLVTTAKKHRRKSCSGSKWKKHIPYNTERLSKTHRSFSDKVILRLHATILFLVIAGSGVLAMRVRVTFCE